MKVRICQRCQFRKPATRSLCHICGDTNHFDYEIPERSERARTLLKGAVASSFGKSRDVGKEIKGNALRLLALVRNSGETSRL